MELGGDPQLVARLWQAAAFGIIVGGLLWTLGLARLHGSAAAAAMIVTMFLPTAWSGALLLSAALISAGIACRIAEARLPTPSVPTRLGAAGVAALAGLAVLAAWTVAGGAPSGYAAGMSAGGLAGSGAAWWRRALSNERATLTSTAAAGAGLTAAFAIGALAWHLDVLGPGEGFLPVVGAAVAMPVASRLGNGPRREAVVASGIAAAATLALMALLP